MGLAAAGATIAIIAAVPILLGFGTTGIAAGSVAAGIQAGSGAIAAGSIFATA